MEGKVFGLMHLEGSSSILPGNDVIKALFIGIVEKFIETTRKGLGLCGTTMTDNISTDTAFEHDGTSYSSSKQPVRAVLIAGG